MRAAVTEAPGVLRVKVTADPGHPGSGEVLVRPELVGVCGSDLHLFGGHLEVAPAPGRSSLYPVVQGHEICAVVEELGEGAGSARMGRGRDVGGRAG